MKKSFWWIATLVLWLWPFAAPAAPPTKKIVFRTKPPGAVIFQVTPGTPDRRLGLAGDPVPVTMPPGNDDNATVTLRFELPGYEPTVLTRQRFTLRGDEYPPPGWPALELKMTLPGAVQAWAGNHVGLLVATTLLLAVGAASLARRRRSLQAARRDLDETGRALASSDRANASLGGYGLMEPLGAGATSTVYRAIRLADPQGPEVAVKVLRYPDPSRAEQARRRFLREAEILGMLSHPAIARLLDWGQEGQVLFLVQELAAGGHLGSLIPPQGLEHEAFLRAFLPIVEAVAHAHDQGIVHRDLKPENVLLTETGEVRVSDFGLARLQDDAETTSTRAGTPLYMAPERFAGRPATPASDQYSLGVMALHMLCGRPPQEGKSLGELMKERALDAADAEAEAARCLESLPPSLRGVVDVVRRMLATAPEERFPDLHAALEALREKS